MRRVRFSIASLLIVVLFLAVGLAALKESTDLWDSALFSTTLAVLVTSTLLAVHQTGRPRAFWLGFALCGWAYLAASLVSQIEPRLLTTKALAYLDSKVEGRAARVTLFINGVSSDWNQNLSGQVLALSTDQVTPKSSAQAVIRLWDSSTGKLLRRSNGTTENFLRIGHSLLALVFAIAGGRLSRKFSRSGICVISESG